MTVSLLVPTFNRSDFVIRLLGYYRDHQFPGQLLIGDSSVGEHAERIQAAIAQLNGQVQVVYRAYPGLKAAACLRELSRLVVTPYAAFLPDDDLYVPEALERGIRFLEAHPDYSAAHGTGLLLKLEGTGAYGTVRSAFPYGLDALEQERASDRLLAHLSHYTVIPYSVRRTGQFRESLEFDPPIPDASFALELFPSSLLAIHGKVKKLDGLFVMHQRYTQQKLLPDHTEWMTSPQWLPSYEMFQERLTVALARQDGISREEAVSVVEYAFWQYVANCLQMWQRRTGTSMSTTRWARLRAFGARQPFLKAAWVAVRRWVPGRQEPELFLPELSRRSSRYHAQFMEFVRVMSAPSVLQQPTATDARPALIGAGTR